MQPKPSTTVISSSGRITIPKAIREQRQWKAGAQLVVEETADGVILKPAPLFPPTRIEDVFGSLKYDGPAKSIEEMDAAIAAEIRRRWQE